MKEKVAVFFGGRSVERDVSTITALQTIAAVDKARYAVMPVYMYDGNFYVGGLDKIGDFAPFDPSAHKKAYLISGGLYTLKRDRLKREFVPDAALICCHGGEGEGGILQAMLEYNGVKYTSCGPFQSALCMDKCMSKRIFSDMLLNVPPYVEITRGDFEADFDGAIARIEEDAYPLIVKPARLGSSIGISAAHDRSELKEALEVAFGFDSVAVVERMLTNFTEVNCAAFRDGDKIVVSETEQPLSSGDFLSFADKYTDGGKLSGGGHVIPADIGAAELIVKATTERIYRELGLDGVVRADYLFDNVSSKLYINEINTVPGSLAFYLFEGMGIGHGELISRLIKNASLKEERPPANFGTDILSRFKSGAKLNKMQA